ncbi:uncharacterized protein N7473_001098 [Penicillium subrubescens]|uniref:uncharacterized protein n=1 Tax=Penicillium subrubescens TaxID=1316194 RepID=UPI00254556F6|nr:uncharacterized protein N7473_001098 [Penicillium subrubescens]KAJ5911795.1 hypothetical protein N7473_001098 [Penicillium subrubescens]
MRNSEESSKTPTRPFFVREVRGPVLPARAWCDLLDTPAFGIRNIGGLSFWFSFLREGLLALDDPMGESVRRLLQYAAYCVLVFLFFPFGREGDESGIIRFRSFWWGWRFNFFLRSVF